MHEVNDSECSLKFLKCTPGWEPLRYGQKPVVRIIFLWILREDNLQQTKSGHNLKPLKVLSQFQYIYQYNIYLELSPR